MVLTFGCSSSNDSIIPQPALTSYFVKFKVNGNQVEFILDGYTHFDDAAGNFNVDDSVDKSAGVGAGRYENEESIALLIENSSDFEVNTTYSNYNSSSSTQPNLLFFTYRNLNGDSFGTVNETDLVNLYPDAVANATIRFTSETATSLSGNFSGRFYNSNDNYVDITEGEFHVLRSDI